MSLCFYCGVEEADTTDHVIPKSRGRIFDRPWNMVPACAYCNQKKGNRNLSTWLEYLAQEQPGYGRFGHEPRRRGIMERREVIVATLLSRPEMRSYRSWIEPRLGCLAHEGSRSPDTCLYAVSRGFGGECKIGGT